MNKKVFIKQDGTIPGHRIIEEFQRRNILNTIPLNGETKGFYVSLKGALDYAIGRFVFYSADDHTELLYNKETDSFYEKSQRMVSAEAKEALFGNGGSLNDLPFGAYDSELEGYEWTIPEGYEATIEDGKVIVRKKWSIENAKPGDIICSPNGSTHDMTLIFKGWKDGPFTFVLAYAGTDISGKLQVTDGHWLINKESRLATQKEKDYLFQKIDEAGYEWSQSDLKLIKIKDL